MGILANISNKIRTAFGGAYGETTGYQTDRGNIMYYLPGDSREYLDQWTRREILRKVEWVTQTFTVVDAAIKHVATLSNGEGICLQLNSDDEDFNEIALADWELFATSPDRFDISGRLNFYETCEELVANRIKIGETFTSHAQNPRWDNAPCIQRWDALEVNSPEKEQPGRTIIDGVQVDKFTAPIAYWVKTAGGKSEPIQASDMMHWYRPAHINDVRGVSELATAVNPLVDAQELVKITTKTAKQNTALGLHVKRMAKAGGQGAIDRISSIGGVAKGGSTTTADGGTNPQYEKLIGGGAIIYTSGEGDDVKMLTPNSPTPLLEPFITKVLLRNALSAFGPAEYFWGLEGLSGTAQRVVLLKADTITRKLGGDVVARFANPVATRYLVWRISIGAIPAPKDPNWMQKMSWQLPGKLSIDNGRDAAAEINQLTNGIETLQGINDRRGRSWKKQIRQWFAEFKYAKKVSTEMGVAWALPYWRPAMPGTNFPTDENAQLTADMPEKPEVPKEDDEEDDAEEDETK